MSKLSEDEKNLLELQERIMAGQQALARVSNCDPDMLAQGKWKFDAFQLQTWTSITVCLQFNQQERLHLQRKQRDELTIRELSTMPDSTPMYKNVGKAWVV